MEAFVVETRRHELVGVRAALVAGAFVLGLLLTLSSAALQDGQGEEAEAIQRVRVAGTKVSLSPPVGFVAATTFPGFQHLESGSSLLVTLLPEPFAKANLGIDDPRQLAKQNMERLAREDRDAGKYPGILMHLRLRVQQIEFEKWMWVFGSANETVMIHGAYPAAVAEEYGPLLRHAVLSARWDPDAEVSALDGLGFSLTNTGTLVFFARMANTVTYTEDGQADLEKQGKAMFVIGPAVRPVAQALGAENRRSFVKRRLRATAHHRDFEIESVEPVTIDALEGFEVVATALSDSSVPTTIYQLTLFEGGSYWLGQGLVRSSERQRFLPMFRNMGRSLARDRLTFESKGGLLRVTAPSGWTKLDMNDDADLQIGHATAECYLVVLSEATADFEAGTTIDDHSKRTRDAFKTDAAVTREVGPRRLEIGGCKAVQYELHSSLSGTAVVFLHTTIEGKEHFHQVLAWTLARGFAKERATLDAVLASIDVGA